MNATMGDKPKPEKPREDEDGHPVVKPLPKQDDDTKPVTVKRDRMG